MRVFKRKRSINGTTRTATGFTLEFRTHRDKVARLAAFDDRASSEELGKKVSRLVSARSLNQPPEPDLQAWIASMPTDLRTRLADLDLLDRQSVAANRPLSEHLAEFRENLIARVCSPKHCRIIPTRAGFVFSTRSSRTQWSGPWRS